MSAPGTLLPKGIRLLCPQLAKANVPAEQSKQTLPFNDHADICNAASLLLAPSKTSEIGITANAWLGNFISSVDFDFLNLYNWPPEIFCEHNATIHLSLLGHSSA
jgi:hypothetical protein